MFNPTYKKKSYYMDFKQVFSVLFKALIHILT